MEFDAPESVDSKSQFCTEPGTYHLIIMETLEGVMPDGKTTMTGGGFSLSFSILEGTVKGQVEKTIGIPFGNPGPEATDKGRLMSSQKRCALFIATDLMQPGQLGARGLKIDVDLSKGRQVIATFERDARPGREKYLQLSYANIYHVDDPRAATFPKSQESLALIPKQLRHDAKYFEPLVSKSKPASANPAAGTRPQLNASQLAEL